MESYRINEEIIELIKIIKSIFETAFMNEFENRKKNLMIYSQILQKDCQKKKKEVLI